MAGKPKTRISKRQNARLTLIEMLNFYPISNQTAFNIAGVHRTTWERWLRGEAHPHPAIVELIRLHATGRIMPDSFTDCYFRNGQLWDDHGNGHTLGDLRVHALYKTHHFKLMSTLRNFDLIPKAQEYLVTDAEKADDVPALPVRLHLVK